MGPQPAGGSFVIGVICYENLDNTPHGNQRVINQCTQKVHQVELHACQ